LGGVGVESTGLACPQLKLTNEAAFCLTSGKKNISRKGPRNCRSLGFARDDKKERVVVGKGPSPTDMAIVEAGNPLATALL
jgi:hypothetical protein